MARPGGPHYVTIDPPTEVLMEASHRPAPTPNPWFAAHPVQKIALYYAILALGVTLLHAIDPNLEGVFTMKRFAEVLASGKKTLAEDTSSIVNVSPIQVSFETVQAMRTALILMLRVT